MRRVVLSSSRILAPASKHSPHKPWHILHCHTWHASNQSHSDMLSISAKSPCPLPLQQTSSGVEEKMHLKQWSHLMPSFHGTPSSPSLGYPINGFGVPLSQTSDNSPRSNTIDIRKTRRILELAHLYTLKEKIKKETSEVVAYDDLLKMCVSMGVASSSTCAMQLVKCLEDASLVFIFHDIVYLNPKKVAQLVHNVIPKPLSLMGEKEGILQEISSLKEEKKDIDKLAYKYSRKILWLGFGYLTLQMLLIFRLTFWDLSWDVMEPIAYFVTNITLLLGYAFFMITSKHPSYRNLGATLCSSKQHKLMRRRNFNMTKFLELQRQCDPTYISLRGTIATH